MDSFDDKNLNKYIIPNAEKLSNSKGSNITNLSKINNDKVLEEYMKNIISNTQCSQQKYTSSKDEEEESLEIKQLIQIIRLNELKLIIQKMDLLDNINLK